MDKSLSYQIFDRISKSYDTINRILSCGTDVYWRSKLSHFVPKDKPLQLIDFATGTGDQLFSLVKRRKNIHQAIGLDLSSQMLNVAREKSSKKVTNEICTFIEADAQNTQLPSESSQLITMSFGIRNVPNPLACLKEMHRILDNTGRACILEFSLPTSKWIKKPYIFYLRHILPPIGNLLSKDSSAYTYLNKTIETFPYGEDFLRLMQEAGFSHTQSLPLSGGIASLYIGDK